MSVQIVIALIDLVVVIVLIVRRWTCVSCFWPPPFPCSRCPVD